MIKLLIFQILWILFLFSDPQGPRDIDNITCAWNKADSIVRSIEIPHFKDNIFNILDYGAVEGGNVLTTQAIQHTIDVCHSNGGGIVEIPAGIFLTAAIHLKSNVNLHLNKDAILLFSTTPSDYLPTVITKWEGVDCYNFSPLIYAYEQSNIAVTGNGKLDGQANASNWWNWKGKKNYGWEEGMNSQLMVDGRPRLMKYEKEQTPIEDRIFGDGYFLRPQFIQLYKCTNILIEDITIENSPFWIIHPLQSENITIRGVNIESNGPNNDGLDPESCKNVLIENCRFSTGDDCIAIKSGRNNDGRRWNIPSENIIIRNCEMRNGHGGVVIGSEISAGCKNIFVENCKMNSPELDRGVRIKTNTNRGGVIEDVYIRNIEIGQVGEAAIKINCNYDTKEGPGNFLPTVRNINVTNMTCELADRAIYLKGIPNENCIYNINISNSTFKSVKEDNLITDVKDLILNNVKINQELSGKDNTCKGINMPE